MSDVWSIIALDGPRNTVLVKTSNSTSPWNLKAYIAFRVNEL